MEASFTSTLPKCRAIYIYQQTIKIIINVTQSGLTRDAELPFEPQGEDKHNTKQYYVSVNSVMMTT